MGAVAAKATPVDADCYPIRLTPEQSVALHGFARAKTTLTWRDVERDPAITFAVCLRHGIQPDKLHLMQGDLDRWILTRKVSLADCYALAPWAPNPFLHFNCGIGDLVVQRHHLPPQVLIRANVRFSMLWDRYGLTAELMSVLRYTPEEWIQLGLEERHLAAIEPPHWARIFGNLRPGDVAAGIARAREQLLQDGADGEA